MAKYSMALKLKIVREYLAGKGGYRTLSKRWQVSSIRLQEWVKSYQAFGEAGLKRSRVQQTYSFEFKRSAVECYLSTEASYQEVALSLGLNNPPHSSDYASGFPKIFADTKKESPYHSVRRLLTDSISVYDGCP